MGVLEELFDFGTFTTTPERSDAGASRLHPPGNLQVDAVEGFGGVREGGDGSDGGLDFVVALLPIEGVEGWGTALVHGFKHDHPRILPGMLRSFSVFSRLLCKLCECRSALPLLRVETIGLTRYELVLVSEGWLVGQHGL